MGRWAGGGRKLANRASRSMCVCGNARDDCVPINTFPARGSAAESLPAILTYCTEQDAVVLIYRVRSHGETEWKDIEQRIPITWTAGYLGGHRLWFVCSVYRIR
jgi:hypothetical protein